MDLNRRALLALAAASAASAASPVMAMPAGALGSLAAARGLIFGSTLTRGQVEESADMRRIATVDMAMIVPGYELKWSGHQPAPDRFDFTNADFMVHFAEERQKLVRGHALVWHEALPPWFQDAPKDEAGMRRLLELHIRTVAGRYAGRIHSWDVVNEPIEPWDKRRDGLRDTPFLRALGPEYLDLAFHLAAEADPKARLTLNEYGVEMATVEQELRRRALLSLLEGMKRRGVPLHAVGIQAHLKAAESSFDPGVFRGFIREVAALGLDCYITELDVTDRGLPADVGVRDEIVARTYRRFLDAALAEPSVKVVVLWGISDRYTWMNDSRYTKREDGLQVRGHPYDRDFRPKPAWHAIADAFRAAPSR